MENELLKQLGTRIREKRKTMDWTQEDLASSAQIDRSYIGGVERGERNLTFSVLCQISAALRCDVSDLTVGLPGLPK
jgi:transcriptional regulator with XRE-family HTH domain